MSRREVYLASYPLVPYGEALNLQRRVVSAKIERGFPDTLILLEHPPVITLGRRAREENIRASQEVLQAEGIEVFHVERGGDVTYHGPGQLVGYPVFSLKHYGKDIPGFVFSIEEALIRLCHDLGIPALRRSLNRGVWVGNKKIASVGLAIRRWISFHGFAFNQAPNMAHFKLINPCGLSAVEMTSAEEILGEAIDSGLLRRQVCRHFEDVFQVSFVEVDLGDELDTRPVREGLEGEPTPFW
ncbi:MAG: lipoyl(octanoyl) transferase LipB [Deltaproteobacteria bacterium]|nr:lipoyl(octanoyl) transferase LipB [Deltaproteobacteria bacterium]MBW2121731.1 lipoyl(octanoyl) transferase LipB [Deltaproteobacteria bacterium]